MSAAPNTEPGAWCEERLHQPREDLHLARLFSPRAQRQTVAATAAIYIELEDIAAGRRDLNVARMKLGWWREEFARLEAGRPEHPATRLLAAATVSVALPQLLDLVTGMEINLLEGAPTELAGARLRAERGCAQLILALGELLAEPQRDASQRDYVRLGIGVGLARQLALPGQARLQAEIADAARSELGAARLPLDSAPPTLRVLAALAWQRSARSQPVTTSRRQANRRVWIAWRAARGHLPHAFG